MSEEHHHVVGFVVCMHFVQHGFISAQICEILRSYYVALVDNCRSGEDHASARRDKFVLVVVQLLAFLAVKSVVRFQNFMQSGF